MAYTTESIHTGDGSTTDFSFTFPYIKEADVKVTIEDDNEQAQATTAFSFANPTTLTFDSAPDDGHRIRIFRDTDIDKAYAEHFPGSSIRADDLNNNNTQTIYSDQERQEHTVGTDGGTFRGDVAFHNNVDLGSSTSKTITATGRFDSDLVPSTDSERDLGTNALRYAEVWSDQTTAGNVRVAVTNDNQIDTASGNLTIDTAGGTVTVDDNLSVSGTSTLAGDVTANGNIDLAGNIDVDGVANLDNVDIDGTVHVQSTSTFVGEITASGGVTGDLTGNADTATDLAAATKITNSEHANHTANDTTYFTTSASDARYFRQDSSETITSGDDWSDSDNFVATTEAISNRIVDLVEEVGGFVPIASETDFPTSNPDINNGAGTLISIKEIGTARTPTNGTVTISEGNADDDDITINGCGTTVLAAGFGCIVETTGTEHTYNFHRLTPKATEVTTVAGSIANVNTVANNIDDINALEDVIADIQTLADIEDGTVAEDAISDLAAIASDVTTCATDIADISTVADDLNEDVSEIETVAGSIANVNTVGGSIANVNTVADDIDNVNSFHQKYKAQDDEPTNPSAGDLWWDTSVDPQLLKAYDADNTQWTAVTTDQEAGLQTSGGTMTGTLVLDSGGSAGAPRLAFSNDSNTGIFSGTGDTVNVTAGGSTRLQINTSEVLSTEPVKSRVTDGDDNTILTALTVERQTTDTTPVNGIGVGMDFRIETGNSNVETGAQIEAVAADVTSGQEDVDLVVNLMAAGADAAEKLRITSTGTIQSANNTDLTLAGGGNGTVAINDNTSIDGDLTIADGKNLILQNDAEDNTISINADNVSDSYNLTLPTAHGSAGQVLRINSVDENDNVELEFGTISQTTISNDTANVECVNDGSNDHIEFDTHGSQRMEVASDGAIRMGSSVLAQSTGTHSQNASLTVQGSKGSNTSASILALVRGNTTANTSNNHTLGRIVFADSQAGEYAYIEGEADANAAANDTPGRLAFSVTADGTSSPIERLTIKNDGNVGISEDSPAAALHVKKDTGDLLRLDRNNTGAVGNQIAFRHSNSGTLTETGSVNCVSTANAATGELRFSTKASGSSNAEKMRIDSAGRLLLNSGSDVRIELGTNGTTATNDRNHLRADGDNLKYNCCDNGNHIWEENGSEHARINSAGNVGIGTASPSDCRLHVKTTTGTVRSKIGSGDSNAAALYLQNNTTGDGNSDGLKLELGGDEEAYIWMHENADMNFGTNNTQQAVIKADGKVGIGTDAPSVELEVAGTGAIEIPQGTTEQRPDGTNAARAGLIRYNTETDMPEFFNEVSNSWATFAVKGGMIKTADPTIPDEIIDQTSATVTNPTVIGGSGTISFTYQWMVELSGTYTNIPNGTSQSVTLPEEVDSTDVLGNKVRCTVTATDGDGFTLVINSNETTVTEFKPNMNPPAGLCVNWNPGSHSGGEATSIGYANLPNNEKAIDVTWGATWHTSRYVLSDAGKVYTFGRTSTGTMSVTQQTGNSYEWSGKTLQGWCFADTSSRPIQIATTGELRYSSNSGSSWSEWLTTTSGFSKVLWHSGCDNHTKTMAVTEDGKVRFATTHANFFNLDGTNQSNVSPTFMGEYITPPSGKKICYVVVLNNGTYGAVLLCNDQRLYAVGNTHVSGFPTNGTRSTPVIVSGVTTKFKQIGNFGNTGNSNQGFQALDVDGNYWCCRANNSDSFSKHFDSTGVTIKSLFGAQLAPYIDNCCTYNQRDLMAIGADKILWTNNLPAGGTDLSEYTIPSSFPSWDHTKTDHGGRTVMTSDHSGDWACIILPQ